jgi:hypothetical protein
MSPSTLSKVERVEQNCVPFPVFPVNLQYMPPPFSCPLTKLDPHFRVPSKVPLPLNPTFRSTPTPLVHRRSWHGLTTPFFLFFLILTCSCQYSYNLMLTSNCMCRPYIDTNNPPIWGRHMQFDVNIRLYEY